MRSVSASSSTVSTLLMVVTAFLAVAAFHVTCVIVLMSDYDHQSGTS